MAARGGPRIRKLYFHPTPAFFLTDVRALNTERGAAKLKTLELTFLTEIANSIALSGRPTWNPGVSAGNFVWGAVVTSAFWPYENTLQVDEKAIRVTLTKCCLDSSISIP